MSDLKKFTLPGYQFSEKIYENNSSVILRGLDQTRRNVIVKFLKNEFPEKKDTDRMESEYHLLKSLEINGVVRPYEMVPAGTGKAMVMEDTGGISLASYIKTDFFSLLGFLKISIQLTEILSKIHARNIIHKDIKPQNILLLENNHVCLIDFGISSIVKREIINASGTGRLEGTLSYISPEQTGRMNRSVDYRSDYYSLGATFYTLLTGKPLFDTTDPILLIHSHIAKIPLSPSSLNQEIPKSLSRIILKLVEKNAEDRYQSSTGLQNDLNRCLEELEKNGFISEFPVGTSDIPDSLQIPEKIYGRDKELLLLENLIHTISESNSSARVFIVSGKAGVGKSSLIREIQKKLVLKNGYFITGKFDQFKKTTPYSAVLSAFKNLINQILSENPASLKAWKEKILSVLGDNVSIITEVIPQLKLITGDLKQAAVLSPNEADIRFGYVFQNFTTLFADHEHPLVLFLDDLQWADHASLQWIGIILKNPALRNFLIIGAMRDNELKGDNPRLLQLQQLKKETEHWLETTLSPLKKADIQQLLTDTFFQTSTSLDTLAEIILEKTGGNPFFITQLIKTLSEKGFISNQGGDIGWSIDIDSIRKAEISDNMLDLLLEKIHNLPETSRLYLQTASCCGNKTGLDLLQEIYHIHEITLLENLKPAIHEGLIFKIEDGIQFSHDRIREAVYQLLDSQEKSVRHYMIGNAMMRMASETELDDDIFTIIQQFNNALSVITDPEEMKKLSGLNLKAGIKAKNASAYEASLRFLETGITLLPLNPWENHYALCVSLYIECGEASYLNGNFERADELFRIVIEKARNPLDKVRVYSLQIILNTVNNQMALAMENGKTALLLFNVKIPKKVQPFHLIKELIQTNLLLLGKTPDKIVALPELKDPVKSAISSLLMLMTLPSYISYPEFLPVIILKLLNFSLRNGNSPYSPYAYTVFGLILSGFLGDVEKGFQFGETGLRLENKLQSKMVKNKIYFLFGNTIQHWKKPMREDLSVLEEGYRAGFENGDLTFASYSVNHSLAHLLFCGENLAQVLESGTNYYEIMKKFKQIDAIYAFNLFYQTAVQLSEVVEHPTQIQGKYFNETEMIPEWNKIKNWTDLGFYTVLKIFLNFLFGDFKEGIRFAETGKSYLPGILGMIYVRYYRYYYTFCLIADYSVQNEQEKKKSMKTILRHIQLFKKWNRLCPENNLHLLLFAEAGLAVIQTRYQTAETLYDRAIETAHKNGYIHEEALILEHAARYYLRAGKERTASSYIRDSAHTYKNWGAAGKLQAVLKEFPDLISISPAFTQLKQQFENSDDKESTRSTSSASASDLDLASVVKASTLISGEIVMEKLLESLIRIAIENTGAETGILLFSKENRITLEVRKSSNGDIEQFASMPLDQTDIVPAGIIRYVARTGESVVLDHACRGGTYTRDKTIANRQVKSVLCVPIKSKAEIIGVLYLENNLAPAVFTSERLQFLNILSGQMGISLENARLYDQLEDYNKNLEIKVDERTHQLKLAHKELSRKHDVMKNELKVARTIQQSLIPNIPDMENLVIAGGYLPMEELGGDLYDVYPISPGKTGLTVLDVSGHGVPAALITSMAKISLLTNSRPDLTVGEIITRVNHEICLAIEDLMQYLTLCYCIVDTDLMELTYTNAGHPEILVLRNQQFIRLEHNGSAVGQDRTVVFKTGKIKLEKNDRIILFTDGIPEGRNENHEFYGMERFEEIIKQTEKQSAQKVIDHVIESVHGFLNGSPMRDDITLLIADFNRPVLHD